MERDIRLLKGVGPKRAEFLARMGIRTVRDLLYTLPLRIEDRTRVTRISDVREGRALVAGMLTRVRALPKRGRGPRVKARLEDASGRIDAVWFGPPRMRAGLFKIEGQEVVAWGRAVETRDGRVQLVPEEMAAISGRSNITGLVPIYPSTDGLSSKQMRSMVGEAMQSSAIEDDLPEELLSRHSLPPLEKALKMTHSPRSEKGRVLAKRRFAYEELLLLQLGMARLRRTLKAALAPEMAVTDGLEREIRSVFPFQFTPSQRRAASAIRADLRGPSPMNRLLCGEVGSGKTAVACYAALAAVKTGLRAAVMAPTQLLAEQHYGRFRSYLARAGAKVGMLTGARKDARGADVLVGTHALIQEDVSIPDLGLAVVDEQHRFGVAQRKALREKARMPHVLVLSATPIPRTLALAFYGELDLSVLTDLPGGRRKVETRVYGRERRRQAYALLRRAVEEGGKAFVICPRVEGEDSAEEAYERLPEEELKGCPVGMVHGRMSAEEKSRALERFRSGEVRVLVATVVVEVGLDVPEASAMLVERAERFGLAQLHQLRGRVGRRGQEGVMLLVAGTARCERLEILARESDGFRIAEEDWRLRGSGEVFGFAQHGAPPLRFADVFGDSGLLEAAREDARGLIERDPELSSHPGLKNRLARGVELAKVG